MTTPLQKIAAEPSIAFVFFWVGAVHPVGILVIHYRVGYTEIGCRTEIHHSVFALVGWNRDNKPESNIKFVIIVPSTVNRSCGMIEVSHDFHLKAEVIIYIFSNGTTELGVPTWQIKVTAYCTNKAVWCYYFSIWSHVNRSNNSSLPFKGKPVAQRQKSLQI